MIMTLQLVFKQDKERFRVPRSVQQAIPIRTIWPDGIFAVGNKFSKSFRFTDINYAVASREDKAAMFLALFGALELPGQRRYHQAHHP